MASSFNNSTYDPDDQTQRAAAKRLNIMVVGESGLGKTTCIQTLLNSLQEKKENLKWKSKKTVSITEVGSRFVDEKGLLPSYCHIYDSPGYGDDIDNQKSFDIIRDDLVARHKEYDHILRTRSNELDQTTLMGLDCRIHCCLYFISPHRMKVIDIEFIKHLREHVVIVPVIAKADTMTRSEREDCLDEVIQAILAIEGDLADKMKARSVPQKDRIRATFNFDDRDELYASTSHFKGLSLAKALALQSTSTSHDDVMADTAQEPPLDISEFRTYLGGDEPSTEVEVLEKSDTDQDNTETDDTETDDKETDDEKKDTAPEEKQGRSVEEGETHTDTPAPSEECKFPAFNSEGQLVNRIKRYHNVFAVVADPSLFRIYEWGGCSVANPLHSDFPILRRLLFQPKTINGMINETRKRTNLLMKSVKGGGGGSSYHLPFPSMAKYWVPLVACSLLAVAPMVLFPEHAAMAASLVRRSVFQGAMPVCLSRSIVDNYEQLEVQHASLLTRSDTCAVDRDAYQASAVAVKLKFSECEVQRDACHSASTSSQKKYNTKQNVHEERLNTCLVDLRVSEDSIADNEKKIKSLQAANRKITAKMKAAEKEAKLDATCFHVDTVINYRGGGYSYEELKAGKEPECTVPHSPSSKGVVISTSCDKTVRVTDTHLMATTKGFQLAFSLKPGDVLFGSYDDEEQCVVMLVEKEKTTQQYFGLNCVHSEVLASGLRASTFGDFHTLPSWYMTYVGGVVGPEVASSLGEYIAEWYFIQ